MQLAICMPPKVFASCGISYTSTETSPLLENGRNTRELSFENFNRSLLLSCAYKCRKHKQKESCGWRLSVQG